MALNDSKRCEITKDSKELSWTYPLWIFRYDKTLIKAGAAWVYNRDNAMCFKSIETMANCFQLLLHASSSPDLDVTTFICPQKKLSLKRNFRQRAGSRVFNPHVIWLKSPQVKIAAILTNLFETRGFALSRRIKSKVLFQ